MPADHSTPEGRRCPECGKDAGQVTGRTGYCPSCGSHFAIVPTPAPVGGVLEKCPRPHHLLLPGERCTDCSFTPTSAEGGEAEQPWPFKCPRCQSNAAHGYCQTCKAPTLAATGEEEQPCNRCGVRGEPSVRLNGGYCNDCAVMPAGVRARLQELLASESEMRRQLAEAEEKLENAEERAKDAEDGRTRDGKVMLHLTKRATTAERQRDEAIRALGTEARMRGSAEQEVARLREALWTDSNLIQMDPSVVFSPGYDFGGWESARQEVHISVGFYAVWPDRIGSPRAWSAYGGPDDVLMLERFPTADAAKAWVWEQIATTLSTTLTSL